MGNIYFDNAATTKLDKEVLEERKKNLGSFTNLPEKVERIMNISIHR